MSDCWSSASVLFQQSGTRFSWGALQSSTGQSLGNTGVYVLQATSLAQPGTYSYLYGDNQGTGVLTISPVSQLLYSFQDKGDDQFSWSFTAPQLTGSQTISVGQCQNCAASSSVQFLQSGAQFDFLGLQSASGQSVESAGVYVVDAYSFTQPGTYAYGYENSFNGDSGTGVLTVSLVAVPEPSCLIPLALALSLLSAGAFGKVNR
jgi:hypothetical protein